MEIIHGDCSLWAFDRHGLLLLAGEGCACLAEAGSRGHFCDGSRSRPRFTFRWHGRTRGFSDLHLAVVIHHRADDVSRRTQVGQEHDFVRPDVE